jgi:uncharacterized protein YndB with AHSA1/START domain
MSPTANPPASIDADAFTVSRTIMIAAPLEKVWAAITEPEHIAQWAGQQATIDAVRVGGKGTWTFEGHGSVPLVIEQLDAPHSISYRWGSTESEAIDPVASTVFTFTLEPADGGTMLSVVESGFNNLGDPPARMEDNRGGWTHELDELVAYVESLA